VADTGRPTKRTPEAQERIFAALRKGMTKKAAAASGGITYTTLREWEHDFPEFAEALKAAESDSQQELLRRSGRPRTSSGRPPPGCSNGAGRRTSPVVRRSR
jgi:transposase